MDKGKVEVIGSSIKRALAQKNYQENIYGTKRKTYQSKEVRVDKRLFNKGRPKGLKKDDNPFPPAPPPRKFNQIETLAGNILAGYLRSKLQANILQPAIFSDLYGAKVNKRLDRQDAGLPMTSPVVPPKKKKGRPPKKP